MAVKTYRKTALVTAEQFLPAIGQIPKGVYSDGHGDPRKRPDCNWVLDTKEGRHNVRGGDYICTGQAGEQWNVAEQIFEATYEEVEAPPPQAYLGGAPEAELMRQKAISNARERNAALRAIQAALDDFELIVDRINAGQINRACATAMQGAKEAKLALAATATEDALSPFKAKEE